MTRKNDRAAGHLLALLTIIIWGTTFVATKILLRDYDALQIMLMRFFLAWVLLLLCLLYTSYRSIQRKLLCLVGRKAAERRLGAGRK